LVVTLHIDIFYQQENAKSNWQGCPLMAREKTKNCREIMLALDLKCTKLQIKENSMYKTTRKENFGTTKCLGVESDRVNCIL